MRRIVYSAVALLVVGGAFLVGAWVSHRAATKPAGGREILYWHDPMHPAYRSDKPGIAPDCGMQLEPVYADGGPAASGAPRRAGAVEISPEKQQLVGVRVAPVGKGSAEHVVRLFGRITPDETRLYTVTAAVDGAIREVSPVTTGSRVRKNQWLATFFSSDVRVPVQAFFSALEVLSRAHEQTQRSLEVKLSDQTMEIAYERLRAVGISNPQIEEIRRTREMPVNVRIHSPADGFVLARNIVPDQVFQRGFEWYRIADLRRVWIVADATEREVKHLQPGTRAQIAIPGLNERLGAKVAEVLPQFDGATRTLKVRFEAENPGFVLRPDMFVDVEVAVSIPDAITVPVDAVVDSGTKKTVFVDKGDGHFEPRVVETGWRLGDQVQVVRGLADGERIVVSGTFLVDSESRMRLAAAGIVSEAVQDPVCGMDVDERKALAAGKVAEHGGKRWVFCSDQCRDQFKASPAKYAHGEATAAAEPAGAALDPVCGMKVDPETARAAARVVEHGGKAHVFCSDQCKAQFQASPAKFVHGDAAVTPASAAGGAGHVH